MTHRSSLGYVLFGGLVGLAGCEGSASSAGGGGSIPVGAAGMGAGSTTGSSSNSNSSTSTGMDPPKPPPYDWMFIIGTGQSLSVGAAAGGAISTAQNFKNLKLVDQGPDPKYPIDGLGAPAYETTPLIEPIRTNVSGSGPGYNDGQYPNNIAGETPHSGMANQLSALWQSRDSSVGDYITAHAVVGWSAHPLKDIDKQGMQRAYPASLAEAQAFKDLATAQGNTFGAGAVVLTHGESDSGNPGYGEGLATFYQDYNQDLKQITGQTEDILMLISQQSTVSPGSNGSAVQVFNAGKDVPGIVCVGPKYAYEYASDLIHLEAGGYLRLGQKYAEVFDKIRNQGIGWKPLGPSAVARADSTITITFDVPTPPLVWEENISPPHQTKHVAWKNGRGFEILDSGGAEVEIGDVQIQGNIIALTMVNPPPPGSALEVRYAIVQDGDGLQGGTDSGLRGQLRDSNEITAFDDETIAVRVVNGSTEVTSDVEGGFSFRTGFDRVSGNGVRAGTMVRRVNSKSTLTLSTAWLGDSATVPLAIKRDLYNYAVHFSMIVN